MVPGRFDFLSGESPGDSAGNAILPNGVAYAARRGGEIGVPRKYGTDDAPRIFLKLSSLNLA